MKKLIALVLALICVLSLAGCQKTSASCQKTISAYIYEIKIKPRVMLRLSVLHNSLIEAEM